MKKGCILLHFNYHFLITEKMFSLSLSNFTLWWYKATFPLSLYNHWEDVFHFHFLITKKMTKQCVQDVSADRLLLLYVINHSCQQCHHFYITLLSFLFMLLALTFHFSNFQSWIAGDPSICELSHSSWEKMELGIAHISHNCHNRQWCTFFKLVYFFAKRTQVFGLFRPIWASLLRIYAHFGVLL